MNELGTGEFTTKQSEQLVTASHWRLMWLRFRRHHLAVVGSVILLVLYFVAGFCEFIAPYDPTQRNASYVLCNPQLPRFVDSQGNWHLRPFVYGIKLEQGEWSRDYVVDEKNMHPIHFFVRGPSYKLWGVFLTDWHLFYADENAPLFFISAEISKSGEYLNVTNVTTLQLECYKTQSLGISECYECYKSIFNEKKKNHPFYKNKKRVVTFVTFGSTQC